MSRHPIADAVLSLEQARDRIEPEYLVPADMVGTAFKALAQQVLDAAPPDPRRLKVVGEIGLLGIRTRMKINKAAAAAAWAVHLEIVAVKNALWLEPPPLSAPGTTGMSNPRSGGHLRDLPASGEPQLKPGWRYEPTPLVMPESIELGIAVQGKHSNCYFITAVNAVAQSDPEALRQMVRQDPDDENVVIVDVPLGTYRLPATLPVDVNTGERTGATSPDGSTLVGYLEKAAAAHFGSWADVALGAPVYPMRWLARDSHPYFNAFPVTEMTDEDVLDVAASPGPSAVGVGRDLSDPALEVLSRSNLAAGHGYTIAGTTSDGRLRLHNPLGELHPEPVSVQDLRTLNALVNWAGDKPHTVPGAPDQVRG